jgi:hypothetical protein
MDAIQPVSADLAEANRRLYALRAKLQADRLVVGPQTTVEQQGIATTRVAGEPSAEGLRLLPAHLGWGSPAVTAVLRRSPQTQPGNSRQPVNDRFSSPALTLSHLADGSLRDNQTDNATISLYPDLALAILRHNHTAAARVWLLLRYFDEQGSGTLRIDQVRDQLTGNHSPWRICGWRQLRHLLGAGEGIFWQRDNDRIWLRSQVKVMATLGVVKLREKAVALPLAVLRQGIGAARAHFYASFHSGRVRQTAAGPQVVPIARATLCTLSGRSRRSQRAYEQRAGVTARRNFVVGEAASSPNHQERAWQQKQALFLYKDHHGQLGQPGRSYMAWQLPNSYSGRYELWPGGGKKFLNRQLVDLQEKRLSGNDQRVVTDDKKHERRYYQDGRRAVKAYDSNHERDVYWRTPRQPGDYQLWHLLPAAPSQA